MRLEVDVTPVDGITDWREVADALLEFLCGAGDVPFPDEVVESVDGIELARGQR